MTPQHIDLFNHVRMGYLLIESAKLDEWTRFATEGLGLHVDRPDASTRVMRIDDHARRLVVVNGPAEDVKAIGWQLDDEAKLNVAVERLRARGAIVERGREDEAQLRGVSSFWRAMGPKQMAIELFTRPLLTQVPLNMLASGFVTGDAGMGHVAITTREPEAMQAFWRDVFDARLSDQIEDRIDGVSLEFMFLRLNERHHSIATAATRGLRLNPLRTSIHHLNLQARSLEDVTQGYLRCRAMGYGMANAIGQHPNDKELSFYAVTPSGFEIELGWNPISVNEATWQPALYRGISLWGHKPGNLTLGYRLGRLGRGLRSLTSREYTVQGDRT